MNDEAEAALLAAGVPEERIHIERFGVAVPQGQPAGAVEHESKPGDAERARITVVRDGLKREFDYADHPSILDAASAAGLEVPFSCTSGVCGTCRAKLVEGQVRRGLRADVPGASADRTRGAVVRRSVTWPGRALPPTTTSAR
jgi:ring-1,2-phenylacetyl-CoA epoxidase subunit PaaE